jgi:uncharacterized membrane protein YfcA
MAVGLSPENWALLALCGVLLSFVTSLLAVEPGPILVPLLAILLPRLGMPAEAAIHSAVATAIALLVPHSIARLGLLRQSERQKIVRLAPAVAAGAFFGASLLPLIPGRSLLAGFAILAALALMDRPRRAIAGLAVVPPVREPNLFIATVKSIASAMFGAGTPLSEGRVPEKAAFALVLSTGAAVSLFQAPSACKACAGYVFMPALIAIAAAAVLIAPLWTTLTGQSAEPRLRPAVVLAAFIMLLAAPFGAPETGKTALAALAPGLCTARPAQAITLAQSYRDPLPALVQRFGPRRGFAAIKTSKSKPSVFLEVARDPAASPQNSRTSGWVTAIEIRPSQKPAIRSVKRASGIEGH